MFKDRPNLIAIRDCMVVVCLALLAGCQSVDTSTNPATGVPTNAESTTVPAAPADLAATAGNAQASLTWSASSGATSYNIKRSTTSGGPYTQLAAVTSPSYTDSTVSNGVTYFYVATAVDSAGESADSAPASVTPDPAITTPAVPTGLAAKAGNAQASLTWSASSSATSYHVKRATTGGGPYTQVAAPTSTSYTDTSLANGTTYYYVVSALDSAGESANSAQVSATPVASATTPATPTNISATAGNAQASLTWSASSGATSYHVKRSTTSGGPYTQTAAPTATSYTDTGLTNGTTYYYVVSALDSAGESANSAQVSAKPAASVTIPATPTALAATAGNAQASLSWSASSGATSYHVKRSTTSGGPFTQIGAPTTTSYTDSSVTNGTTYYYVVSALDSAGESANSAQVSALPSAPPSGPSGPPPTTFGTWTNVTPSNVNLIDNLDCGNFGTQMIQADPTNPSNVYAEFNCQGIWKSSDYGQTWTGPINTGTNGATAGDCAGGITLAPTASLPIIYESCLRGNATGLWVSTDAGVNWTHHTVGPLPDGAQDIGGQVGVDPYNSNHILIVGHEQNYIGESADGGKTWTSIPMAGGMQGSPGTAVIFFINTGSSSTTSNTWLWVSEASGGAYGTWRTSNSGSTWSRVDTNEHGHGTTQIYQPDTSGVVYVAGLYSALGWGVLRSTNYGQTWTHVGNAGSQGIVFGTSKNVYSMYSWACGVICSVSPNFELGSQPGTGTWAQPGTPSAMAQGAGEVAVTNDGSHNILISANWGSGLWRYVEP